MRQTDPSSLEAQGKPVAGPEHWTLRNFCCFREKKRKVCWEDFTRCVTVGELCSLSESQFPRLQEVGAEEEALLRCGSRTLQGPPASRPCHRLPSPEAPGGAGCGCLPGALPPPAQASGGSRDPQGRDSAATPQDAEFPRGSHREA